LYFGTYLFLMLYGMGDRRFVVVEQRNIPRFPDPPAEDESRYVPSNLNNRLESPAYAAGPTWDDIEAGGFVVILIVRMSGHRRIPSMFRVSPMFAHAPITANSRYDSAESCRTPLPSKVRLSPHFQIGLP
jgi:hypothetical protein